MPHWCRSKFLIWIMDSRYRLQFNANFKIPTVQDITCISDRTHYPRPQYELMSCKWLNFHSPGGVQFLKIFSPAEASMLSAPNAIRRFSFPLFELLLVIFFNVLLTTIINWKWVLVAFLSPLGESATPRK